MNQPAASGNDLVPARQNRWWRYGVVVCLVTQFVLACDAARRLTPTHDEYWHLPIGLLIWKTGRVDCDVINPPLLRLWAALPLALGGAKLDTNEQSLLPGQIGDRFWFGNHERRILWFTCGRIMVALINAGTGWLLVCWGRRWFGESAGFAAAVLFCGCPTMLAHGSLVTHDAAAAFGFVLTLYSIVCWREQPTWRRAVLAGISLGVAQLLKVTCIILFPLAVVVWLLVPCSTQTATDSRPSWRKLAGQWLMVFGLAIFVINLGYGFYQSGQSLRSMSFASQRFLHLQKVDWLSSLPLPFPRSYIQAFDRVAQDLQNSHSVFMDCRWREGGFPEYYLKAIAYKLPVGTLVMLAATFGMLISGAIRSLFWRKKGDGLITPQQTAGDQTTTEPGTIDQQAAGPAPTAWRRQLPLLIPIFTLIVPASFGNNQLGIRYIMPVLPLVYLFCSQAAIPLSRARWNWQSLLIFLTLISVPFSLRFHPNHIAYFNELFGGPEEGRNLLIDSNLDWGQDLQGLSDYLHVNKIGKIGLAYFGSVHPQSVGIQFELPPKSFPRPGDYAISANFLMGRRFVIKAPTENGRPPVVAIDAADSMTGVVTTQDDEFRYFRFFTPKARIGYSIYVYRLSVEDINRYRMALKRAQQP